MRNHTCKPQRTGGNPSDGITMPNSLLAFVYTPRVG
jgi:hypothetical protein